MVPDSTNDVPCLVEESFLVGVEDVLGIIWSRQRILSGEELRYKPWRFRLDYLPLTGLS